MTTTETHYQHAIVRDLAWVMRSPGILDPAHFMELVESRDGPAVPANTQTSSSLVVDDHWCRRVYQQNRAWLKAQDDDPSALQQWLRQRASHRLGYYFESLVEYWLAYLYHEGLLVKHVQVHKDKQTVGEFDFLFAENSARVLQHWEVAVKFYLYYRSNDGPGRWYGPLARDRLDRKVNHLYHHQIALGHSGAGRQAISGYGYGQLHSSIFLKGYLFYPSTSDWRTGANRHAAVSASHLTGWWTPLGQLAVPRTSDSSCWYQVPRRRWLSPLMLDNRQSGELIPHDRLCDWCHGLWQSRPEPMMLAEMAPAVNDAWIEVSRGFVVGDDWPGHLR